MSATAAPDSRPEVRVCLGLGANIHPEENLRLAVSRLRQRLAVLAVSQVWQTAAIGTEGPDFLNAALLACTRLTPAQLKQEIIRPLESEMGRVRTADKNAPRPIDIDLLVYGEEILAPQLWQQGFLAVPVAELLADLSSPETGETLVQAAQRLGPGAIVRLRPEIRLG